jgi:hypothetical protein
VAKNHANLDRVASIDARRSYLFVGVSLGVQSWVQVNVQRRDRLIVRSRTCKDVP